VLVAGAGRRPGCFLAGLVARVALAVLVVGELSSSSWPQTWSPEPLTGSVVGSWLCRRLGGVRQVAQLVLVAVRAGDDVASV
jgi:hypothetical protein